MKQYKILVKEFLAERTAALRKLRNPTQDEMAERLRITSRAYGDLERGKYCFSAITLLFLLLMLSNAERKDFLDRFREQVHDMEQQEAA